MPAITANGIRIEVERHGLESAPALLLIRGLGSQLIHWPAEMIGAFIAAGFQVVTFDNRDSGLSERFDHIGTPDFAAPGGPAAPYTIDDMAEDAVGVLDAFGIERAHVLGISMGGMILQCLAANHPDRLLSATIVMSGSGAPDLPKRSPEIEALLLSGPADPSDRAQVIEHTLASDYAWGNPGYPFDADRRRDLIGRAYDRCHTPGGIARQYAAVQTSRDRHERISRISVPTLVIHGTDDTLLSIDHGRDLHARIPGSHLVEVEGMGHDLDGGAWAVVVDAVLDHIRRLPG